MAKLRGISVGRNCSHRNSKVRKTYDGIENITSRRVRSFERSCVAHAILDNRETSPTTPEKRRGPEERRVIREKRLRRVAARNEKKPRAGRRCRNARIATTLKRVRAGARLSSLNRPREKARKK